MLQTLLGVYLAANAYILGYVSNVVVVATPVPVTVQVESKVVSIPEKEVILEIPIIKQIYKLSCEAASLQMALAFKKIQKNQDELLSLIGISEPKQSYSKDGNIIWGDPDLGFVGDVNGSFSTVDLNLATATGWGVSNIPVAKTAKQFLPNSEAYAGYSIEQIIKELDSGNPIIFWHKRDSFSSDVFKYKTLAGKDISFTRDHVAVIAGYTLVDNKLSFVIKDPQYGAFNLSERDLVRWMNKMSGKVVVVR